MVGTFTCTQDFAAKNGAASWKQGDDLGTITTTDGNVYLGAKLREVAPDGITIVDSDGGAKIAFEKLPPELQLKFGYDPQKAQEYSQDQGAQIQIAQLQDENAKTTIRTFPVQRSAKPSTPGCGGSASSAFQKRIHLLL
jgi:hypothetical protein